MTDQLLLTIDGHSLAFRAFYALPPEMIARDGTPTNAVYGFFSMLSGVIAQFNPTHLAVAFDTAAPTFRSEKDEDYKAQRDETPELFIPQVDLIIDMLCAMNIEVVMKDGVEADDIIATYVTQADEKKMKSISVTGDRDYFQLVKDPYTKVMYVRRGVSDTVIYDEDGIIERTGIRPDQYVDYAAMRGDPSDNLPGINGVGEKTAAKLLNQYEDLDGIYKNLDELSAKQKEKFVDGQERAFLNQEIMTLVRNVKGIAKLEKLERKPGDAKAITELCDQLQFRTLSKKILSAAMVDSSVEIKPSSGSKKPSSSKKKKDTTTTSSIEDITFESIEVQQAIDLIENSKSIYALHFDPLSPGEYVNDLKFPLTPLFGIDNKLYKVTIKNKTNLKKFLDCITQHSLRAIGYDVKSWGSYFAFCELTLCGANDIYIMAAIDDAGRGKKTYDQACAHYLGVAPTQAQAQLGLEGIDDSAPANEEYDKAKVYYLFELYDEMLSRLKAKKLESLYADIELPLISVISEIETYGVLVDRPRLKKISKDIHERCAKYEKEIQSYASEPFNVNSTQQLGKVLFDEIGLTPIKKTKTGLSTDAATLNALLGQHPIIETILNYREVEKLRSTYIDALDPLVAVDGRIHATFNQAITSTGRISSEAPNLQNIPIRSEEGKNLRTMFVAPEDYVLCAIDYSQIELRVLAHMAKEPTLVEAFNKGVDVHATTASQIFEVDIDKVDAKQRNFAKVVNFGIAYGMESYGLATRMGIDPGHAKEILDSYWSKFARMKKYLDSVVEQAKKVGYTETMFGRRRYFPELSSSIARVRIAGARAATNAPVQGTAADIFKLSMVQVSNLIREQGLPAHMVLTVHDELVFEIREDSVNEITKEIVSVMENVVELDVPLVVDVGTGPNWAEAK